MCLSENAAASDHVLNEIEIAYNKKKSPDVSPLIIEPLCIEPIDLDAPQFDEIMYYIRRINFISPTNLSSPKAIAQEVIEKNKDYLKIEASKHHERAQSLYFPSERETKRLKIQGNLLKKFDNETYQKLFSKFEQMDVLDVGSGNGDMLMDRLKESKKPFRLLGVERDAQKVEQANANYGDEGKVHFAVMDVNDPEFSESVADEMDKMGIEGFDVIHISMLLLHMESFCSLLRKCRRLLKSDGYIFIKDIDDGLNYAFPDEKNAFERIYQICDRNETSGNRRNGREIYTNLYRAGLKKISLEKSGFTTIGLSYEEKEAFWGMYFQFILGDIKWMYEKYPNNIDIKDDCEWYSKNYEDLFEQFMNDDFVFSLGFQIYLAQK